MRDDKFNFRKPVAYKHNEMLAFHACARRQLRALAKALALREGSFDLRCSPGGGAGSGKVTLHAESLYVQVSQPICGGDGVLFRACDGRQDIQDGPNHSASLDLLNSPRKLKRLIRKALASNRRTRAQKDTPYWL